MSRKHYRKFRRIKKEGENSQVIITMRSFFRKRWVRVGLGCFVIALILLGIYLYNRFNTYDDYKVLKSIKVESGANSKYIPYGEFVAKYSGEGISYIDGKETIWSQGHEMKSPIIDVCEEYLAIADKNTNDIYIYNEEGQQSKVKTSYPITKIEVANQGVVSALLTDKDANYIEVYDKEGKQLVSHKTLFHENGYPINYSLSDDGTRMVVSYLTINSGVLKNKIIFYNFDKAGKNAADRIVGEFDQYKESIVPTVQFVNQDDVIAVGEDVLSIYSMSSKPELEEEIEIKDEIQKLFYNDEYVGMVFKNSNSKSPYRIEVYNLNGNRKLSHNVKMEFDTIKFAGENVLMYNDMNCMILSFNGIKKFEYTFKKQINDIIPLSESNTYLLMTNSKIQKIRLD